MSGLAESLALVRPSLDPVLVSPGLLDRVERLAHLLAPVHRAGFECRLEAGDLQVDFQQCFLTADGEPGTLAAAITAANSGTGRSLSTAWQPIYRLCREWSTPGTRLPDLVREIWLEFDLPETPPQRLTDLRPSVFLQLRRNEGNAADSMVLGAVEVLSWLVGEGDARGLRAGLARCAAACPEPSSITHLGVMLGRDSPGLRVNVSRVPVEEMATFLERAGWAGDGASISRLAEELLQFVDGVVLCLDVAEEVQPRLGLECFFGPRPDTDPRLKWLLGHLVERGLCTPEKRAGLLGWPGLLTPPGSTGPWPEGLLVGDLIQPAHRLTALVRRWSHVKVDCTPGQPLRSKAYFGFAPVLVDLVAAPPPGTGPDQEALIRDRVQKAVIAPAAPPGHAEPSQAVLVDAIERAVDFLIRTRSQSGLWRDCLSPASPDDPTQRILSGTGDEYVSGYVGCALAGCQVVGGALAERTLRTARATWSRLLGRHGPEDGWAWNAYSCQDADSTSWVLRLAQALGESGSVRATNARKLLLRQMGSDGGVAAYAPGLFRPHGTPDGWAIAHNSVTAVAAVLDLGPGPLEFLRRVQLPDGSWTDYWWDDDEFASARAVEALRRQATPENRQAVSRAVRWAANRLSEAKPAGGSPFPIALCVQILVPEDGQIESEARRRGMAWLIHQQRNDGSFPASARGKLPSADAIEPTGLPELTIHSLDDHGIFTTATALATLCAVYSADSRRDGE